MRDIRILSRCSWCLSGSSSICVNDDVRITMIFDRSGERTSNCQYGADIEVLCSDATMRFPRSNRIFISTEPSAFGHYSSDQDTRRIKEYYGLILSWHPKLRRLENCYVYHPGGLRVKTKYPKTFGVSGCFSHKANLRLNGYGLRHEILRREMEIKIPSLVYNYRKTWRGNPVPYPIADKGRTMMNMFHLAIENCSESGYFTEKLMDCFYSSVVPLYFGDPDIGTVFNATGIIVLNPRTFVEQINALTEADYLSRLAAMEENRKTSEQFYSTGAVMCMAIWKALSQAKH